MVHIRKKRRESVPVARPTHRGLRIARYSWTSNAEAPRRYVYILLTPHAKTHGYNEGLYKTYPQGIYRCHVPDCTRKLRSFYASKNKASSKRLSTIYVSPFQPPFLQRLRHGDKAKIKKKRKSGLKRMKKIPIQRQKSTSAERKINLSRTIFQSQPNDFSFCGRISHGYKTL